MQYVADSTRYDRMEYRRCGNSGLLLPAISLGLWHNFGDTGNLERMRAICRTAFDAGITHFDLANNYGPPADSAEKNFASLDQSLMRMGLDYVDIFYHHCPDPNTPLEETMGALAQAVQSGKALYVGLSNYDGATMQKAAAILKALHCPFVINQNRYSMLDRTVERNGLLDACQTEQKGLILFSPLAQGLLTDRYLHGSIPADSRIQTDGRFLQAAQLTPELLAKLHALQDLAQQREQSLAQLALCWLLQKQTVTSVLVGASRPEQLLDNLQACAAAPLTAAQQQKIDTILGISAET